MRAERGRNPERKDDLALALALAAALAACALPSALRAPLVGQREPLSSLTVAAHRVLVNSASAGELCALPGVGAVLAERIVAERRRRPFADADDLRRVRGIGPHLAARVARHARFICTPRWPAAGESSIRRVRAK